MLQYNSNVSFQFMFFNSILHDDAQMKASEVSDLNDAHEQLLITKKKTLSEIVMFVGMTSVFCVKVL